MGGGGKAQIGLQPPASCLIGLAIVQYNVAAIAARIGKGDSQTQPGSAQMILSRPAPERVCHCPSGYASMLKYLRKPARDSSIACAYSGTVRRSSPKSSISTGFQHASRLEQCVVIRILGDFG